MLCCHLRGACGCRHAPVAATAGQGKCVKTPATAAKAAPKHKTWRQTPNPPLPHPFLAAHQAPTPGRPAPRRPAACSCRVGPTWTLPRGQRAASPSTPPWGERPGWRGAVVCCPAPSGKWCASAVGPCFACWQPAASGQRSAPATGLNRCAYLWPQLPRRARVTAPSGASGVSCPPPSPVPRSARARYEADDVIAAVAEWVSPTMTARSRRQPVAVLCDCATIAAAGQPLHSLAPHPLPCSGPLGP